MGAGASRAFRDNGNVVFFPRRGARVRSHDEGKPLGQPEIIALAILALGLAMALHAIAARDFWRVDWNSDVNPVAAVFDE